MSCVCPGIVNLMELHFAPYYGAGNIRQPLWKGASVASLSVKSTVKFVGFFFFAYLPFCFSDVQKQTIPEQGPLLARRVDHQEYSVTGERRQLGTPDGLLHISMR